MAEVSTFLPLLVVVALLALTVKVLWEIRNDQRLDCGCLSSAVYGCMTCGYTRCVEHRYVPHECNNKLGKTT